MNVDMSYLNVDSSTIGINPSGAQAKWDTVSAILPVNVVGLADMGVMSSTNFNNLTCAKLESASYNVQKILVTDGEVFLVKTPGGHFAKVRITLMTPGALVPTLTWKTYKP